MTRLRLSSDLAGIGLFVLDETSSLQKPVLAQQSTADESQGPPLHLQRLKSRTLVVPVE